MSVVRTTLFIALIVLAAGCLTAGAEDTERVEGMIEEVHPNDFVLNSGGRRVVVDVSALGGVTAAITKGQTIAAIGTMAPDKRQFRAVRLEPATASALKPTAR